MLTKMIYLSNLMVTKQPLQIFALRLFLSLVLTLLYFVFLMGGSWGLGFTVINLLFLGALVIQRPELLSKPRNLVFLGASIAISLFFSFRAFYLGQWINQGLIIVLNSLLVLNPQGDLSLKDCLTAPIYLFFRSLVEWPENILTIKTYLFHQKTAGFGQKLKLAFSGVVIAIPLLAIFLVLFLNADPLFQHYFNSLLPKDFYLDIELISKIIQLGFVFALFSTGFRQHTGQPATSSWLDQVMQNRREIASACVFIIILTGTFLAVQAQYLFATEELLKQMGVMLSEYTRRGYTELLLVSSISLSLILIITHRAREISQSWIKMVAWVFILEVFLLLLSASRRVYLYQEAHGFTLIRILGILFSIWLTGTLGIFALKLWGRLKEKTLILALLINTIVVDFFMNILNPDYTIAVIRKPTLGYGIDYRYITGRSADGYAGWEEALTAMENKSPCEGEVGAVASRLRQKHTEFQADAKNNWHNFGSWKLSEQNANNYIQDNYKRIMQLTEENLACQSEGPR